MRPGEYSTDYMDPDTVDQLRAGAVEGARGGDANPDSATGPNRVHHGGANDPRVLDFSANTNPQMPDGVAQVYESSLAAARSYPPNDYCSFRASAAGHVGCEATEIVPTPGGLAAIRLAIATTVRSGDEVLLPYPSFGEYAREVRLQGGEPTFVSHDVLLDTEPETFALAMVCTPNNPTGEGYEPARLRAYAERCRESDTVFLVDEAFLGFAELESLAGEPGVIVVRSLTKLFGFPGLRLGFAVATGRQRERLDTARLTWGVGGPTVAVGSYCLEQEAFIEETRDRVHTERKRLRERLEDRFDVYPSDAPFLLLELQEGDSVEAVNSAVRASDIAVRDARTFRGLDNHVRVAVRMPEENDRLLDALDV